MSRFGYAVMCIMQMHDLYGSRLQFNLVDRILSFIKNLHIS